MSLTPTDKLAGILPVVISGGRPQIKQRRTAGFLRDLHGITADPVWSVMDEHAIGYEEDGHEIAVYTRAWAEEYAAAHWTHIRPPEPGGFLGATPGREWACRLAAERGCWAVLQLDDNINQLSCFRGRKAGKRVVNFRGGLALYADVLAAITLSTNGWMTGAFLESVAPQKFKVSRVGFPYSLFLERVGPGREEWFGPFEDDITHAFQYGSNGSPAQTALLVPWLLYKKETKSKSGMRANYNSERSVALQRMFPESAGIGIRKSFSNGRGQPRVFHTMSNTAIRTPQIITDRDLYGRVTAQATSMAGEFATLFQQELRERVNKRAARYRTTTPG